MSRSYAGLQRRHLAAEPIDPVVREALWEAELLDRLHRVSLWRGERLEPTGAGRHALDRAACRIPAAR